MYSVQFLGKHSHEKRPYSVFNEKVSSEIGRVMGLSCAEVLIEPINGIVHSLSNWQVTEDDGMALPLGSSLSTQAAMIDHYDDIVGMLVFDLYMANNDRQPDNMLQKGNGHFVLIDHGNALLYYVRSGGSTPHGIERLDAIEADLMAMFETDREHHFMFLLPESDLLSRWCERVKAIPNHFIESVVAQCPDHVGINKETKARTVDFLIRRKKYLLDHIEKNRKRLLRMKGDG